ncbi:MAG: NADH-quinone oxidoreductase subunit NuoE [Ignavibacteriae bacterium]|nr:NADH-quinone oxidoreductase subunit NuoE [Ignavibacteriota bacterium]
MLSEENLKKVEKLKPRFQTTQALTLPVLWMIQQQHGWISSEAMLYVAQLLNVPVSHVYGVVTFYTMYNQKPVGKYHLQVCTNVSCMLNGGEELRDHVCERLGVKLGETTSDSRFTVTEVECLGSCGTAPMMQVNDDYFENISLEQVDELLEKLS